MIGYRVLDIETVLDDRFWTPPDAKWKQIPVEDEYVAMPGGTLVHRSKLGGRGLQTMWVQEDPFPPSQAHRIVAMAWVDLSADENEWYKLVGCKTECAWTHAGDEGSDAIERALLANFVDAQEGDEATIVTWNGRTFDLPVINMRSFLHALPCEWYYKERDLRYRYTEACHCDLMDVMADYGAARSVKLGDAARMIGLPGKKGEVSGASVASFYERGDEAKDMTTIADYCLRDALQTAVLFARHRAHRGMVSYDYYRDVVLPSFKEICKDKLDVDVEKLR